MGGSKTKPPQACHELEGTCHICGCCADSEVQELVGLDCSFRMCQCNDMQLLWHQTCIEKYLRGHKLERYSRLLRVPGFHANALSKRTSITPLTLSRQHTHLCLQEQAQWFPLPKRSWQAGPNRVSSQVPWHGKYIDVLG